MNKTTNASLIFGGLALIAFVVVSTAAYQSLAFIFNPATQVAQVTGAGGLQFSVDELGVQNLSYNNYKLISASNAGGYGAFYGDKIRYHVPVFQTPGGATITPDSSEASTTLANPLPWASTGAATCPVTKTNEQCYKQIFRQGLKDSYTINVELSSFDSNTMLADVYLTNNDTTDTIVSFNYNDWLGTGMYIPDLALNQWFGNFTVNPVAFIPGATWGNLAVFSTDYGKKAQLTTRNDYATVGVTTPPTNVNLLWDFSVTEHIGPGQTFHYPLYFRFSGLSSTAMSLASEAYASYASSHPLLNDWTDRRPITRWFMAEGTAHTSKLNPRGYLWDANLDVSNQTNFNTQILNKTDEIVTRMNGMDPKPQGIVVWDLEGEEFSQYFTYVGYPNKLHDMAPEMDAVADQMFQKFRTAGYKIGITLRPGDFQTGTLANRPTTCHGGDYNYDTDDIYIATDVAYPNRAYDCVAPNTWQQRDRTGIFHQHSPADDATLLANLKSKVTYAYNRWGVTMFYVDSTVYSDRGGGNPFNSQIFTDLMTYLKTTAPYSSTKFVFFPENENRDFFSSTAPYNQVDNGIFTSSQDAKNIWPKAFSILAHVNVDGNLQHPEWKANYVQSIKDGNIFFEEGIWYAPDEIVSQLYHDAGITNATLGIGSTTPPTPPATTYTLSYTAGANGSITGSLTQTVNAGANGSTVIAVANTGYHLVDWSDGSTANPRTDTSVGANLSVIANFVQDTVVIIPDTTAPTAPSNLKATAPNSSSVNLNWTASVDNVGITGYAITRNGQVIATTPTASYTDSAVVSGTTYTYSVVASDAAGNLSAPSNGATVTVPVVSGPTPVAIVSFSVSQKTATTATIKWTTSVASTGSISYGLTNKATGSIVNDTNLTTLHVLTISGLTKATKYYFKITATNPVNGTQTVSTVSNFRTQAK